MGSLLPLFFWHGFHGLHGFWFGGIQLRPFGYMPRHLKRGITGRNITVMVRRIDTYQGFKSQLPKGFQVFLAPRLNKNQSGFNGARGFHGLHGFFKIRGSGFAYCRCLVAGLHSQGPGKSMAGAALPMHKPDFTRRRGHGFHPIDQHVLIGMG